MSVGDGFIFAMFAGVMTFVVVVLWRGILRAPRPGDVEMVLIGVAAGEIEMQTWTDALRMAGIRARAVNVGDIPSQVTSIYSYEVWVRARDERRARQVLGL